MFVSTREHHLQCTEAAVTTPFLNGKKKWAVPVFSVKNTWTLGSNAENDSYFKAKYDEKNVSGAWPYRYVVFYQN